MAEQPTDQLVPCPECGRKVWPNTIRCPKCGYRFSMSEAAYRFEKVPQVAREVGRSVAANLPDLVVMAFVFVVACGVSGFVYLMGFSILFGMLPLSIESRDSAIGLAAVLAGLAAIPTAALVCYFVRRLQR
jgi:hypothetical protein